MICNKLFGFYDLQRLLCTDFMLKQFAVIFLFAAFAVQTFNKAIVVFNYYANTSAFAKNCENKARPMLHCNGRCQMMKKLKQEENKDKQNPERRNENKNEVLYFSKNSFSIQQNKISVTINYPRFNDTNTKKIAFDFFQPPRA
ncbi:MAG TPA: hypothetical protein VHP12_07405 [Chitinophagaceae bacterium]|nr:hypothetical protein [Chitinophagaceae bacterium]